MTITSFGALMDWIHANENKYCFRCYKRRCELTSSLGRFLNSRRSERHGLEFYVFKEFALGLLDVFDEIAFSKAISFGQHHGLPTRFIDFTVDPFVALYFGLGRSKDNGTFKLCHLNETNPAIEPVLKQIYTKLSSMDNMCFQDIDKLNFGQLDGLSPNTMLSKSYVQSIKFERDFMDYFSGQSDFSLVPYDIDEDSNLRIIAQKGLFIAMKYPEEPISESVFSEFEINLAHHDTQALKREVDRHIDPTLLFPNCVNGLNVSDLAERIRAKYDIKES